MKVNSHPTLSIPRNFTFFSIPIIFIHPNDCSTRLRLQRYKIGCLLSWIARIQRSKLSERL